MSAQPKKTVVIWGDSIAANNGNVEASWPAICLRSLQVVAHPGFPISIVNQGTCGKPTAAALGEFAERITPHQPDLVIIQFGFNDLRYDGSRQGQPLSLPAEFTAHLVTMAAQCRDSAGARVVIFGNHRPRRHLLMPDGIAYDETAARYNAAAEHAAKDAGVPYYDMSRELSTEYDWKELVCPDGVHLSATGNIAYADRALGIILRHLA